MPASAALTPVTCMGIIDMDHLPLTPAQVLAAYVRMTEQPVELKDPPASLQEALQDVVNEFPGTTEHERQTHTQAIALAARISDGRKWQAFNAYLAAERANTVEKFA